MASFVPHLAVMDAAPSRVMWARPRSGLDARRAWPSDASRESNTRGGRGGDNLPSITFLFITERQEQRNVPVTHAPLCTPLLDGQ